MKSLLAVTIRRFHQTEPLTARLTWGRCAPLALALMVATGCGSTASDAQPADTSATAPAAESAEPQATATTPADQPAATAELTSETHTTATSEPAIVGQAPGYADYPYMGQLPTGEDLYYIYSEPLDCEGFEDATDCENSRRVEFVQVDTMGIAENGSAIADCHNEELTEIIVDNDLVAYQMSLNEVTLLNLWTYACESSEFSGLKSDDIDDIEPTNIESLVIQPFEAGTPYAEYREFLLNLGLVPKAVTLDAYTLLEQRMYDAGYIEVLGCSGEGLCRFEFEHPEPGYLAAGQVIAVITYLEGQTPYTYSVSQDFSVALD